MHDSIFQIGTKTDFNIHKCSVNCIFAKLLNIHKDWEIIMQRKWCTETRFVDIWLGAWTANPYFANIVWLHRLNILDKPFVWEVYKTKMHAHWKLRVFWNHNFHPCFPRYLLKVKWHYIHLHVFFCSWSFYMPVFYATTYLRGKAFLAPRRNTIHFEVATIHYWLL